MLSIQHIIKEYAQHRALNDVSMEIESGKIFGLLGPNGAGKTSLIRIINQITAPDKGEIYFNGQKLNQTHISKIGYLPEERGLYKKMEIGEQTIYLARLKGLSRADAIERVKYWFDKMDMQAWWKKRVEDLSKGMQQKVQFVATVLHQPELIILDEPFSGFDPLNAELIKNEIIELHKKGATILFSTHRMESVESLCQHIVVLNKSNKILDGTIKDIKNEYRTGTYHIELDQPIDLSGNPNFEIIQHEVTANSTFSYQIKVLPITSLNQLLSEIIPIANIIKVEENIPSINEIFIQKVKQFN